MSELIEETTDVRELKRAVRNRGSESYLSVEQRQELEDWLGAQETVILEEVRDEIEARYGIVYQSKQSYYDLLDASGLRYHRTEKGNPIRKQFALNQTFAQVKRCFSSFLKSLHFTSTKLSWYWPTEQMI